MTLNLANLQFKCWLLKWNYFSEFSNSVITLFFFLPLKMENIVYVSPSLQQKSSLVTALVFISTGKCPVLSTTTIDQTANVRLAHMFSQDWRISVLRTLVTPPVKSSLILLMQCMLPTIPQASLQFVYTHEHRNASKRVSRATRKINPATNFVLTRKRFLPGNR